MMHRNTPAPAAATTTDMPLLQWHNGRSVARATPTARFAGFVGFSVEAGRWELFDRLAHELGVPRVEVRHAREGGTEVKPHWSLGETLRVYPLTCGPLHMTMTAAARDPHASAEGAGLVALWRRNEKSRLSFQVLAEVGGVVDAAVPLILTVRSLMTDYLFAALIEHIQVCVQADDPATGRVVFPWHLALPLGPGADAAFGKREATEVTPLCALYPTPLVLDDLWLNTEIVAYAAALVEAAGAWAQGEVAVFEAAQGVAA